MSDTTDTTVAIAEPSGRNPLVVVLAIVATLAGAALVWFFLVAPLLLGDDAGADAPAAAATDGSDGLAEAPTTEEPVEEPADAIATLPVVTYEVFLARDPFDPVVPEPTSTSGDGDTSPTDDATDSTDGSTTDDGSSDDDPATGCGDEDEPVCDGRVVSLIEISEEDGERVAVIQLDTTIYEVRVGDVFASSFLVQAIESDRVTLIYGDDVITLELGDRVLK